MSPLIISSSLSSKSRSRILAEAAKSALEKQGHTPTLFDLRESPLPMCDGETAYGGEHVAPLAEAIRTADGVLCATPVYNFDVNAALKNAIELTGKAWTGQVVGFLAAAGGQGSYMSLMGVANSLMLDFRCIILPRFVYATGEAFEAGDITDEDLVRRLDEVGERLTVLASVTESFRPTPE